MENLSRKLPSWVAKIPDWLCAYCQARKVLTFLPDREPLPVNNLHAMRRNKAEKSFKDELIEALDFGFDMIEQTQQALADDGKIKGAEYVGYVKPLLKAPAALTGLDQPLDKYRALAPADRKEVFDYAQERFDLPDDEVERLIEDTIVEVYGDIVIAKRWGDFVRNKRARRLAA